MNSGRKKMKYPDTEKGNIEWTALTRKEKNRQLFFQQKKTLDLFLERGAISEAQYNKSLHDLMEKMNVEGETTWIIRELEDDETELLKDFLYEAIFIPAGMDPPDRAIIERPELSLYYRDFGSGPADNCLVAEIDGKVVGAVWTRIMNDYGHVDDETPSFAISLYRDCRGRGIGTALMRRMLGLLREQGWKKASLAVQKANYAVRMYEKAGFVTVDENDEEYIMVCEL